MRERSLFYWSEVFYKQLDKGEAYDLLRKTICINILEFKLINDEKFLVSNATLLLIPSFPLIVGF
ncbi:MAG: Rpn family recombination-promoting nuclease/putative transposase [Streptococcaceae bacterium]|jgi:predicted transposase/invertase (TIGR01784 family)|nr:Rpn family recombination-promoting nuclease/putative transposase [Streptococcaceae bacterium]